jgi:hypothetical protein
MRPRARPGQRGVRGGRGKDDYDDVDLPDVPLIDAVPKIGGEVAIWVYVPVTDEIQDWLAEFRLTVMDCFYSLFQRALTYARSAEEREGLHAELAERLRVHGPRGHAIELNVAEARRMQVQSRQQQLDTFLRRAIMTFNQSWGTVEHVIMKMRAHLEDDMGVLRAFIDQLSVQKATKSFEILTRDLQSADRKFGVVLEKGIRTSTQEIEKFAGMFHASNERFRRGVDDGSCSVDEREMITRAFETLETHAKPQIEALHEKLAEQRVEIEKKRAEIIADYESRLPHHQADVALIESITQARQEAKSRYDTILSKSRMQETEIDILMSRLRAFTETDLDPQEKARTIIADLETIRTLIIARGFMLRQIKSSLSPSISTYPIQFDVDSAANASDGPVLDRRSRSRTAGRASAKQAAPKDSKKKPAVARKTKSGVPDTLKEADTSTLEGQVEQIRVDLINSLNLVATEYYTNLKNRKGNITRPDAIPLTQPELLDAAAQDWAKETQGLPAFCERAAIQFRYQVASSYDLAKMCEEMVYLLLGEFYREKITRERDQLQVKFDAELRALTLERKGHQDQLSITLGDPNSTAEFDALVAAERARTQKEVQAVATFRTSVVEWERGVMNAYSKVLPVVTNSLLQLLDNFTLLEDLVGGQQPVPRRTMRALLKEKERTMSRPNVPERPFHQRDWPSLRVVMDPLFRRPPPMSATASDADSKGGSHVSKKRKGGGTSTPSADPPVQGFDVDEMMPIVSSLETPLHRGVILDRNKEYGRYSQELAKRISDLDAYIQSVNTGTDQFSQYWASCALAIQPASQNPVRPLTAPPK